MENQPRLITAQYPSRCGVCSKQIRIGDRVYWAKGQKTIHEDCFKPQGISKPTAKYDPDFVIDWHELKPIIREATAPNGKLTGWQNAGYRTRFRSEYDGGSWSGFTRGEVHRWVTEGYESSALQGLTGLTPPIREKRRWLYVEDGDELLVDRAMAGEDNFMIRPTKREVIPGVRLNIELDASAGSSAMLVDYQRWIAQTIYALQTSGVDCEIQIFTLSRNLFREQHGITRQAVRVKEFGESAVDFAGFSAMFSPAAFRGVMFSLFALHAERQRLTLLGHGSGVTNDWGCRYQPETKSIDVACHWTATSFPETRMTGLLRDAIEDMRKDPF